MSYSELINPVWKGFEGSQELFTNVKLTFVAAMFIYAVTEGERIPTVLVAY